MKSKEAQEQSILIHWCKMQENIYPALKLIYAIPNGGYRNKIEAKNLKLQGVKAGVPDLFLSFPVDMYHGLYIEMKYGKNKPTEHQEEWIKRLEAVGYKCVVCYSATEGIEAIKKYLHIK